MTASGIRHTRNSKNYRAPVLLDQRSMIRFGLVMSLFLVIIFMSGYVVGFQQAETRQAAPVARFELELPEPVASAVDETVPQTPVHAEPGEDIDVDSADEMELAQLTDVPVATSQSHKPATRISDNPEVIDTDSHSSSSNNDDVITVSMGIGGPLTSDPGQDDVDKSILYGNATRESALYSIQVGMYSSLDNAERRVEELNNTELNAYYDEYLNKNNNTRYNVRFGYFANHRSARRALEIYQQEMSGTGYIVKLPPALASR